MQITNDRYKKNPGKFGPKSVIGTYLRTMNMTQYKDLHYSDSEQLSQNAATAPIAEVQIDEDYENKLKEQLAAGEITQEQYNTLTKTNRVQYENGARLGDLNENGILVGLQDLPLAAEPDTPQEQTPQYQVPENY